MSAQMGSVNDKAACKQDPFVKELQNWHRCTREELDVNDTARLISADEVMKARIRHTRGGKQVLNGIDPIFGTGWRSWPSNLGCNDEHDLARIL